MAAKSISPNGKTVSDRVTGLTWQRSPDTNGDGAITTTDKLTWVQAQAHPAALNAAAFGGFDDWRLPTIHELYSLILFNGTDPSGCCASAVILSSRVVNQAPGHGGQLSG